MSPGVESRRTQIAEAIGLIRETLNVGSEERPWILLDPDYVSKLALAFVDEGWTKSLVGLPSEIEDVVGEAIYEYEHDIDRMLSVEYPSYGSDEMHGINRYRGMARASIDAINMHRKEHPQ